MAKPDNAVTGMIHFKALEIANEHRNSYGLRYNDHDRYRTHCANRVHRIRSSLKYTHGRGREFKKLPVVALQNIKPAHLELLLFESERAWARAQSILTSPKITPNLRHNATGRLRRALSWSTQLLARCTALHALSPAPRLSASCTAHAAAYTLLISARVLRTRLFFSDALPQFCVARIILDSLAASSSSSEERALAQKWVDVVGPEIRYCAHELGWERAWDVDAVVESQRAKMDDVMEGCKALLEEVMEEGAKSGGGEEKRLEEMMWEGEVVPVRNPELVGVLLKVQHAQKAFDLVGAQDQGGEGGGSKEKKVSGARSKKQGVAAYDAILLALSDAEEVARKLVEAHQLTSGGIGGVGGSGSSAQIPGQTRDVHFAHAYIVYQLLARRIQRDLLLLSALIASSPSSFSSSSDGGGRLHPAIVKLLDSVLQSLEQMRALSVVDDSPDLASAVDTRLYFTKARRCMYLARCYTPIKRYAEALTLIQRATVHLRESRSYNTTPAFDPTTSDGKPFYSHLLTDASTLESTLLAEALQIKKDWFAFNGGGGEGEAFQKPLFFDVALNYVQVDMDRLRSRAGKLPTTATVVEKKTTTATAVEAEVERPKPTDKHAAPAGVLSSLLGGWWGRT